MTHERLQHGEVHAGLGQGGGEGVAQGMWMTSRDPGPVARLERGEADPRLSTIERYAEVVGWLLEARSA